MVLHTTEPQYRIDRATMRGLVFAPATERLSWPGAVTQCADRAMTPAGAGQLWAFRLEAESADHANEYFMSSTAAIYFVAGGKPRVAFYDTQQPDGNDNLLISRAQEAYDAHRNHSRWLVDMNDKTLTMMLKDAEQRDRIITPDTRNLLLNGTYASDASTTAVLGDQQLATDVQTWLARKGYTTGYNWLLSEQELDKLGVNDQRAELRRVGVGGYGNVMYYLLANVQCNFFGRARGVRDNSTGNKG
jgi:hypothetical protein